MVIGQGNFGPTPHSLKSYVTGFGGKMVANPFICLLDIKLQQHNMIGDELVNFL